jgi:hypothetical protein
MKKTFSFASILLCLAVLGDSRPGLAGSPGPIPADLLERLEQDGWKQIQPGVMQRESDDGTVETLGYGSDGLRFKLAEMKAQLVFLRKEYALRPSVELRQAIRAHRAEIQRTQTALKKPDTAGKLESASDALVAGTSCTANYDATVSVLPHALGASAKADAYFENGCGYVGEVYAHAYAKATTAANEIATTTQSDPAPNTPRIGENVAASASASVNGVTDCYSYAYSSVTNYDLGITYSQSGTSSTCPQQTTFRGTPFLLLGAIKAADFDNGGEGVAFHEVTPSSGSDYRRTGGVDLSSDTVIQLEIGEWLEYTVDIGNEGTYSIVAQVGAAGAGGSFHVELDGVNVTGPVSVPVTGGTHRWGSAIKSGVRFAPGRHVLRFAVDGAFGGFYSLRIVPEQTPFGGTPRTLPGTIRAADFDEGGELIGYHDTSLGCSGSCAYRLADVDRWDRVVYRTATGEWLKYTVDVTATGTYTLSLRVGASQGGAIFHVEFDGVDVTGPLTMPTTGGWSTYQTVTVPGVSLTAGRKVMRLVMDDGKNLIDAGSFDTITIQP